VKERPHYLVVNADESEPGTCKDREIMRHDPHLLIEGCLIASFAMQANACYIYIRGEYVREREVLEAAIAEAYREKLIGRGNIHGWDFDVYVHHGAGAYICGEETGPARESRGQEGAAEAEAAVPRRGGPLRLPDHGEQRRVDRGGRRDPASGRGLVLRLRAAQQHRTKLMCVSGHVERPCNVEETMSIPLKQLLEEHCGGVRGGWGNLKAVIPGGSSVAMIPAEQCETALMDFDSLRDLKSGLGTAAVIVMDKSTDLVRAISRIAYFYKHESCGQCTPVPRGHRLDVARDGAHGAGQADAARDRPAARRRQPGGGPHHLRARRRRRLADPGPVPPLPPRGGGPHRALPRQQAPRAGRHPRGGGVARAASSHQPAPGRTARCAARFCDG
jgi:NADH-quinone oxidoreductase subunit F